MKKKTHIMVVDDNHEMLRIVGRVLELEGYDVSTAPDGNTALALLDECRPDLVLLDIMMPGLDGFQVIVHIRRHSDVPIIMLTAKHEVTLLRKALVLGADDYIRKPFDAQVLVARVRAKLRRTTQAVASC